MKNLKTALFLLLSATILGCQSENLIPLVPNEVLRLNYVTVDAQFCTLPPANSSQKIKYLFILDHSGSNQPGFPLTPGDVSSTDPNGARRYGPMVQFISNLVPDPNNLTSFALIDFSDGAYTPGNPIGFDTDSAHFLGTVVQPDWGGCFGTDGKGIGCPNPLIAQPRDAGFTNYTSALQSALTLITNDIHSESLNAATPPVTVNYKIVFVSDGLPIIQNGSVTYTQVFATDIQPLIASIVGLKNNPLYTQLISGISLNTAYYYQATPIVAAETLLTQMSQAGNGQYTEFGAGASIVYQAFAPPVRNVIYNLADAWVENENAVWWDNGQLMLDSDGDGLPDQIETKMGSNPFVADSDGNGVSDLVEYRSKGAPCNDLKCAPAGRDPYSICSGFSPNMASDGTVTFPSSSNDGFNSCEKFVLGATPSDFDSNGDFIPDLLSFKNSIPFISGTSGAFLNPFGDALNNYAKLKAGLPNSISQNKVLNFTQRDTSLEHVFNSSPDIQCYHMVAKNVAVLNGGNKIKVSIIQNEAVIDNKPVLQTAVRQLDGQATSISFVPSDFK